MAKKLRFSLITQQGGSLRLLKPAPKPLKNSLSYAISLTFFIGFLHAGQVTRKKFRLIAIEKDLQYLEEEGFPLPETISLDQWEQLMLLENTFARNKYFDVMFTENNLEPLKDEQFEKILEDDKSRIGPLRLDQEVRQLWLFLSQIPLFLKFAHNHFIKLE